MNFDCLASALVFQILFCGKDQHFFAFPSHNKWSQGAGSAWKISPRIFAPSVLHISRTSCSRNSHYQVDQIWATFCKVQYSAKRWRLQVAWSLVLAPSGRGGEPTQPSLHLLAEYCTYPVEQKNCARGWSRTAHTVAGVGSTSNAVYLFNRVP